MRDPETIVREFLDAWDEPDLERLVEGLSAFISPDAVLRQMPFAEVRGREGLRRICQESLESLSDFEIDLVDISSVGRRVFTERVDRFVLQGRPVSVPVLGVFELDENDRITAWRDYFDSRALFATPEPIFGRSEP